MICIVVLLRVKDRQMLNQFESQVEKIMTRYGGKMISAFEPDETLSSVNNADEIHYLEFPSIEAFNAYRADSQYKELAQLRAQAISNTIVYVSKTTHTYGT